MKMSLGPKTLALPSPVWVVGSYGPEGQPNISVVAWASICCSAPPCLAISLRPSRATHANILQRQAFTVNIPSRRFLPESDLAGAVSASQADKFSLTGLTAVPSQLVDAPYIQQFPLVLECRLRQQIELGSHTQFIGEILDVKAEDGVLGAGGLPVAQKIDPILCSAPESAYYALGGFLEVRGLRAAGILKNQR
jgi:flavin reductase (DIM6/NTAB) family NADH-FMN oxidoreductase RutF